MSTFRRINEITWENSNSGVSAQSGNNSIYAGAPGSQGNQGVSGIDGYNSPIFHPKYYILRAEKANSVSPPVLSTEYFLCSKRMDTSTISNAYGVPINLNNVNVTYNSLRYVLEALVINAKITVYTDETLSTILASVQQDSLLPDVMHRVTTTITLPSNPFASNLYIVYSVADSHRSPPALFGCMGVRIYAEWYTV